ncbi:Porphobilinogen deaminase isoform 2 [Schistosoma japonicum]|uniref:hydroxymethylbilane synthase n=1 Tax=Schistosoma japonicum TaxID=6182 RepID=A0A4Z2CPR4_SCHJA|nr:Porphobilinogen deaminase [Schistosoma japonicum]TNN06241.1 Porphobilinogen deaminase isoform 2 [Schistosoma japonicum]
MLDASSQHAVRVGSRRSNLALLQTEMAISLLKVQKPHIMFEVVEIATVGDEILDVPLSKIGDKSLFTKELEKSLLVGEVDLVVHSLKDVPSVLPTGLVLGCVFGRSSPEDVVLMAPHNRGMKLSDLPVGATVGTSSIRRVATLIRKYPHLKFISIRGNLNTRLAKLDTPSNLQKQCCTGNQSLSYDALILAKAGVERMGWVDRIDQVLSDSFYAVSQGALACECLQNNTFIMDLLSLIHDESSALTAIAERSLMHQLDGGCSIPISVRSDLTLKEDFKSSKLTLHANILSVDGVKSVERSASVVFPEIIPTNDCMKWSRVLLSQLNVYGDSNTNTPIMENDEALLSSLTEVTCLIPLILH